MPKAVLLVGLLADWIVGDRKAIAAYPPPARVHRAGIAGKRSGWDSHVNIYTLCRSLRAP